MKRLMWLVLAIALAFGAVACEKADDKSNAELDGLKQEITALKQENADLKAQIAELTKPAPEFVFGSDATWPPMEFVNSDKEVVGFDIDLIKAIGRAAGFTPVIKNTAWDGIFAALAAGKVDGVISSVTITDKRREVMDFSDPYFTVQQAVVVKKDSGIRSVADLSGKKIGGQIGTTGYFAAKEIEGATAQTYDEVGMAIEDLFNGRIDAVICDDPIAADFALQQAQYSKALTIGFVIPTETSEEFGIAVQKGNTELLELVNKGLAAIKESGEYDIIRAKWIGN